MNEVILNKKVQIERCVAQINRYYSEAGSESFEQDYLRQDAIAMNLQRLVRSCIDIANQLVKKRKLGLPQNSADTFDLLRRAGLISAELAASLTKMVGFRNVLVHQYQQINLNVMVDVIENHLHEPLDFANKALEASP